MEVYHIYISENAYGIKYFTFSLAIIHKHNLRMLTKWETLWSNYGWSIVFTPSKKAHTAKVEDLLKAIFKNGLKISPKKCQLFKKELQYMGNIIFTKDRKVCVKPIRSRLEAIEKLKPPTTPKGCWIFTGMVNF